MYYLWHAGQICLAIWIYTVRPSLCCYLTRLLWLTHNFRKLLCPYASEGCEFRTHQKSNLKTHIRQGRQCVLFIIFLPPHWFGILLSLTKMKNHVFVLIATFELVIRHRSSGIENGNTTNTYLVVARPNPRLLQLPRSPCHLSHHPESL